VSRWSRIALAACWLVVAFLLLRMAWGGSLFGIVYVLNYTSPAILIAGAVTIVAAVAVVILLARSAIGWALWTSVALSFIAIPLSVILSTQDHGSAPAITAAAVIAMTLALRGVTSLASEPSPPEV